MRPDPAPFADDPEDDEFLLGDALAEDEFDGPDLGPDDRDRDLMDGSWEERHYAGRHRQRDWHAIYLGVSLLVLLGLIIPSLMVLLR